MLESQNESTFSEVISRNHLRWLSDFTVEADKSWEERLGEDFKRLEPELESCVSVHGGWGIAYSATPEIDELFLQIGQTYLRRMWSQDLVGLEERIGGYQFNEYLGVLAALSGRAQKHLCFSTILKRREPRLDYRNLLTTYCPCEVLIISLAVFLDADTKMIRDLLGSLTLEPSNLSAHTDTSDTAWAPVVRSSADFYILPLYGLETNPFLFLLNDLRHRYPDDWFRTANNREARWQLDIEAAFPGNQWNVRSQNLRLRDNGNTLTDIDFLVYDGEHNQVGIIQLKWQQPIGVDNRARRSAGKNLVKQGNDWIKRVMRWLAKNGADELLKRVGIEGMRDAVPTLFVIARYNAFYSGFFDQDGRATWADWGHFLKARIENSRMPLASLARKIREETARLSAEYRGESYFLPLGDTAVVVNPSKKPTAR